MGVTSIVGRRHAHFSTSFAQASMTSLPATILPAANPLPRSLAALRPIVVDDLARYGHRGDGGYVLPASALRDIDAVLSFGVSTDWTFEEDLAARKPDLIIHAYDHTVGAKQLRQRIALDLRTMSIGRAGVRPLLGSIRALSSYRRFFRDAHVHFPQRVYSRLDEGCDVTVAQVFARLPPRSRVLLKMDIEGGEYRVMRHVLEFADRIDVMIVEFHDTDPLRETFTSSIERICSEFKVVHVHGNNFAGRAEDGLPEVLEVSFLNARLAGGHARRNVLPIEGLDHPNDPSRPDWQIRFE